MPKTIFQNAALFLKKKGNSTDKDEESSYRTQSGLSDSSHSRAESISGSDRPRSRKEEECLLNLQLACQLAGIPASDNTIFRFACYYDFNHDLARKALIERYDDPHLNLRMEGELVEQFQNLVIFPLPGLMTKNKKHEVLYFHACRHFPAEMDTNLLIKNVCYVMNEMSLTEEQCRNGVALIIDLHQWTFKNFTNECSHKFLKAIQHQVPTKVASVLIVNPPRWFPKVWKMLKKVLSPSFAKRFVILKKQSQLQDYLMDGYEGYLPMEMAGSQDSTEIVEDFVDLKLHVESNQQVDALTANEDGW
ncbi:unnamed protein product [Cylindrotheca closterium]|uniref:CRAL-TRIO domain-containing protein n=1 Tax=Cylindrotheca closterium TaxID=2856 RepID=A0AAD2CEM6_9STRA|nr:unnamed protein product [Cylindrotheca closterium]